MGTLNHWYPPEINKWKPIELNWGIVQQAMELTVLKRLINQYFLRNSAHIDRWSLINLPKKRPWAMWAIVGTAGQSPHNDFDGDMFRKSAKIAVMACHDLTSQKCVFIRSTSKNWGSIQPSRCGWVDYNDLASRCHLYDVHWTGVAIPN